MSRDPFGDWPAIRTVGTLAAVDGHPPGDGRHDDKREFAHCASCADLSIFGGQIKNWDARRHLSQPS